MFLLFSQNQEKTTNGSGYNLFHIWNSNNN